MQTLRKKTEGFTIIEVMIVLVIAAVILLIVFLAIPALQRNSRNTQRKNDVASLLAATAEYSTNHQGDFPANQTAFDTDVFANAKTGFYKTNTDVVYTPNPGTVTVISDNETRVFIYTGVKCNGNTPTKTGATSRQVAATFNIESSSGLTTEQCQEG